MADTIESRSDALNVAKQNVTQLWKYIDMTDSDFKQYNKLKLHDAFKIPEKFITQSTANKTSTLAGYRKIFGGFAWVSRDKNDVVDKLLDCSVICKFCYQTDARTGVLGAEVAALRTHEQTPGNGATVERVFSFLTKLDASDRQRMGEETLYNLLFLRANWRVVKELANEFAARASSSDRGGVLSKARADERDRKRQRAVDEADATASSFGSASSSSSSSSSSSMGGFSAASKPLK